MSATDGRGSDDGDRAAAWHCAWEKALADLEADLSNVEHALATVPGATEHADAAYTSTWVPPQNLGPLPPALLPTAQALLARQQRATIDLQDRLSYERRQCAVTQHVHDATNTPRTAAFVDLKA